MRKGLRVFDADTHVEPTAEVLDTYVDPAVREEAFDIAKLLKGEGYAKLLAEVTDQAEWEGTPLLAAAALEKRLHRAIDN